MTAAEEPGPARLDADAFADRAGALGGLLAEVVAGGASLGFVLPFAAEDGAAWWRAKQPDVASGALTVFTAADADGTLLGTVALARSPMPNQRHRGDIVKLMVRPAARGRGTARALLGAAERYAAGTGTRLLMLDTETGSPAERLYTAAGWTRYGVVPDFATDPHGRLGDCSFFYKHLA